MKLKNLTFAYSKNQKIINNLSYNFSNTGLYFLYGKNGIGKTTLFDLIIGKLKPNEGEIIFDGLNSNNYYDYIGYYKTSNQLMNELSVYDVLNVFKVKQEEINEVIKYFRLDKILKVKCKKISTGEKQRLTLALIFLNKRPVYLLDEPFSHISSSDIDSILKYIEKIMEKSLIIIISHNRNLSKKIKCQELEFNGHELIEINSIHFENKNEVFTKTKLNSFIIFKHYIKYFIFDIIFIFVISLFYSASFLKINDYINSNLETNIKNINCANNALISKDKLNIEEFGNIIFYQERFFDILSFEEENTIFNNYYFSLCEYQDILIGDHRKNDNEITLGIDFKHFNKVILQTLINQKVTIFNEEYILKGFYDNQSSSVEININKNFEKKLLLYSLANTNHTNISFSNIFYYMSNNVIINEDVKQPIYTSENNNFSFNYNTPFGKIDFTIDNALSLSEYQSLYENINLEESNKIYISSNLLMDSIYKQIPIKAYFFPSLEEKEKSYSNETIDLNVTYKRIYYMDTVPLEYFSIFTCLSLLIGEICFIVKDKVYKNVYLDLKRSEYFGFKNIKEIINISIFLTTIIGLIPSFIYLCLHNTLYIIIIYFIIICFISWLLQFNKIKKHFLEEEKYD